MTDHKNAMHRGKKAVTLLLAGLLLTVCASCGTKMPVRSSEANGLPETAPTATAEQTAATQPAATEAPALPTTEAPAQPPAEPVPVYAKTYESGVETYTYSDYTLDEQGRITGYTQTPVNGGKHTFTLTYDENGNLLSERDESSHGYDLRLCRYDENGTLVQTRYESDWSIQNGKVFNYTYEYDAQGRVSKKHTTAEHAADYYMDETFTYDDAGRVTQRTEASASNTYDITLSYDANGNLASESAVNRESGKGFVTTYTYEIVGYYTP